MDNWKKPKQKWRDVKEKKRQRKQVVMLLEKTKEEELKLQIIENEKQEAAEKEAGTVVNPSTVSMAVPGSILENAQSIELRTYLAGQIARAACIYNVDEIVVFDDNAAGNLSNAKMSNIETAEGIQTARPCCVQFARILQYLECPQYLRKYFFPIHNDLKFSGLLNPLDSQHHLRLQSAFMYREGIVTDKQHKKGSFVNIGLLNDILVDKQLSPGLRVTVKLDTIAAETKTKKLKGKIVPPSEPRRATGIYWGYNVRIANSISQVFSQSPYSDGYDITIGTSDKGLPVNEVVNKSLAFNHLLIVFGGLFGLENALENDDALNVDDPSLIFDHYFNVVSKQGSRTIRTEEAVLITLAALADKINPLNETREFTYKEAIPQSEDTGMKRNDFIPKKEKKRKRENVEVENLEGPAKKVSEINNENVIVDFKDQNLDRFD